MLLYLGYYNMYLSGLEFSLDICPGVGFLDHFLTLFLVFDGMPILFPIVASPVYIPTNSVEGFPFLLPPWPVILLICPYHLSLSNILNAAVKVTQSCPTLWDPNPNPNPNPNPMNRSTPGLPVHHHLPESTQTHVHWVGDAIQPSHPLSSPSPPALNLSQHQGLFKWVNSLHQVAKVLEFNYHKGGY